MTETLEGDVLPWLLDAAEDFAERIDEYESFPNNMVNNFISKAEATHHETVER